MARTTNILVIDDDPTFLALISELLGDEGFTISTASTHQEAVSNLRREQFQVIICDLVRVPGPGDDGPPDWVDTIEAITFHFTKTPIIVVSGFVPNMPFKALEERGVVSILPKPFRRDELLREVMLALRSTPSTRE